MRNGGVKITLHFRQKMGYHTMVVEQIGILTRRSRVSREARALTTNQMLTISLNITLLQSLSMSTSIPNHNNLYPNIEIIY
jgi:hypothetical protein